MPDTNTLENEPGMQPLIASPISILYVDDEEGLLDMGKHFLERTGTFRVDTLTSAQKALTSPNLHSYDAIVSDYQMPDMDGLEFLLEVRKQLQNIPFILFTGKGREEVVIKAIENGVDFYLQKGGDPASQFAELSDKIKKAIERRRAVTDLKEKSEYLNSIFSSVKEGIAIIDAHTHEILDVNPAAEDLIGTEKRNIINRLCHAFLCPDEEGKCPVSSLHQMVDHSKRTLITADGTLVPIIKSVVPFTFQGRECLLETFFDYSEQERAHNDLLAPYEQISATEEELREQYNELRSLQESLQESEKKFRTIVETSPDAIWDLSPDGVFTYISPQSSAIIGYSPEELIGNNLGTILNPEGRRKMKGILEDGMVRKSGLLTFEIPALHKDGSQRILNIRSFPLEDTSGNRTGFRGITCDVTERTVMIQALKESEERFRLMAERSSDLIIILNDQLCATYISPSVLTITGYTSQELIGKSSDYAGPLLFPLDIAEFKRIFHTLQKRESVEDVNIRIQTKTGKSAFVNLYAVPILSNNILTGAQVSMRVITSVKEIKAALFESEEKYRLLAENIHDVIWTSDLNMQLTYISPSITRALGFTQEGALEMGLEDFLTPDSLQTFKRIQKQAFEINKAGKPLEERVVLELEFKRRVGSPVWAELIMSTAFDANKNVTGFLGVTRDISKRKVTEDLLRKSEEKYRSFVENANDIVFSMTPNGIMTYVPEKWTGLFGYENNEVIGSHASQFIHPDDYSRIVDFVRKKVIGEKDHGTVECRLLHKNGSWQWHSLSYSPIFDEKGRVVLIQGISHDINERKRTEDALKRANRQLGLLTGITRHDILNKIAIIYGFLELMEKKIVDPSLTEYFEIMNTVTNDIQIQIEFTRIYEELGSQDPKWVLIDSVIPRSQLPSSVTLTTDIRGISIFADPMLEKVFFNLLDNSIRHGMTVSEIRVSARNEDDFLFVLWEDNGVGIAEDEKEKIFERGFGKNTGLGMFLVREILSLTDITIIENGEPGVGARFEMRIPRESYRIKT
ncbi:PAS domain S-box protein [Methanospirillum stamsii]|uniref:histidine kinase n=1 Tax=Methanospirillum stamsii TaxID=1277351 RepID=A0A2V2N244_9EURY|nr:PAS domain S-box protein [Methanospirillum stamsii]PWR69521.1 hypothetical protein DLD82_17835 [Methanospirillum stamsii]